MMFGSRWVDEALLKRLESRSTLAGSDRDLLRVETPFSGETLGKLPMSNPGDVEVAVRQISRVQEDWARRSFRERATILLRFHDLLWERKEEILDLIQLETGKARCHAFEEVADAAIMSRYYAYHARRHLRPRRRMGLYPLLTRTREHFFPCGIVGFITPWNYPFTLALSDAVAALMAGNGVILKPDRLTPYTALWGVDLLYESGLPPELAQVVIGRGSELAPPIIENVDYLAFTGSIQTGRLLAARSGENLIGCTMELGGKNAMIIMEDANLGRAARVAVWDCFASTGQLCVSIERIYVHATVFEEFTRLFAEETRSQRLGAALNYDFEMGSLISEEQLNKVKAHVDDAVSKGASVVTGGKARPDLGPYFYEPTILRDVTTDMDVLTEETFGPVVSLNECESIDEAVEKVNEGNYGLNAAIWTRHTKKGRRAAARINTGTVSINDSYRTTWSSADSTQGGCKDSGLGRRHGAMGISKYTEPRTVTVQRLLPVGPPKVMKEESFHNLLGICIRLIRRIPGLR